jgi:hypothetical protein
MAGLTAATLVKHDRIKIFLKKYRKKESFELVSGGKVTLKVQKTNIEVLKSGIQANIARLRFVEDTKHKRPPPRTFSTGHFKKTDEFKQRDTLIHEKTAIAIINKAIQDNGGVISLTVGRHTYHQLTKAIQITTALKQKHGIKGETKADFIICVDPKDPFGIGTVYVSHKAEGGADNFQQFSGITSRSGILDVISDEAKEEIDHFSWTGPSLHAQSNDPELRWKADQEPGEYRFSVGAWSEEHGASNRTRFFVEVVESK